jgi:hypothetical protein
MSWRPVVILASPNAPSAIGSMQHVARQPPVNPLRRQCQLCSGGHDRANRCTQRHLPCFPPCKNVNSAASRLLPACHFSGKSSQMTQNTITFVITHLLITITHSELFCSPSLYTAMHYPHPLSELLSYLKNLN